MSKQGPGKIVLKDPKFSSLEVEIEVHLYNFDINVAKPLKDEHKKFLDHMIVPALTANKNASAGLGGSASRSGEEDPNFVLSKDRAKAVQNHLITNGLGSQVTEIAGLGEPRWAGLNEDERDRAVFILLRFPLRLEDVRLWTDDWTRELVEDDIVGLAGRVDKKWVNKINIQVEVSGVPRFWILDSGLVTLMPTEFPLEAVGKRGGRIIPKHLWSIPLAAPQFQPNDPSRTLYRLSGSADELWMFDLNKSKFGGVASVHRNGGTADIDLQNLSWDVLGRAIQGGSGYPRGIDALRLFQAGGVEGLSLEGGVHPRNWAIPWLSRRPADVFYYSGDGKKDGCLAIGNSCWASAKDLLDYWKNQPNLKALILAASSVLDMNVSNGTATGGPGSEWAKLLKSGNAGGPLVAILGYEDEAPAEKHVGEEIAKKMGKKIAKGLKEDEWVRAWLEINGDHDGRNTWNAVGLDRRGYWWIEEKSTWDKSKGFIPFTGDSYDIKGPAVISR